MSYIFFFGHFLFCFLISVSLFFKKRFWRHKDFCTVMYLLQIAMNTLQIAIPQWLRLQDPNAENSDCKLKLLSSQKKKSPLGGKRDSKQHFKHFQCKRHQSFTEPVNDKLPQWKGEKVYLSMVAGVRTQVRTISSISTDNETQVKITQGGKTKRGRNIRDNTQEDQTIKIKQEVTKERPSTSQKVGHQDDKCYIPKYVRLYIYFIWRVDILDHLTSVVYTWVGMYVCMCTSLTCWVWVSPLH